ncbi:hypothetical protein E6C60_3681 [Paenibacillus algicola]|uniref:Uncharacterized protein n=1 Tax=Paenibacillus algicola TaxID=2565926 RepID=A0A4P8XUB3_9BACL|nr:hypothetical protein E6C60_3681 [Paenibacillus algicola]
MVRMILGIPSVHHLFQLQTMLSQSMYISLASQWRFSYFHHRLFYYQDYKTLLV